MARRSARAIGAEPVEPLWTAADVAERLGIDVRTVRTYQRAIGAIKVGRAVRFRREDVLAFENRGRIAAPVPTPLETERDRRRPALKHTTELNPLTGLRWGEYRTEAGL